MPSFSSRIFDEEATRAAARALYGNNERVIHVNLRDRLSGHGAEGAGAAPMTAADLRAFEREVADAFEAGKIRGPVHLSDGNEDQLIEIFKEIPRTAFVFSTWRSHYHALLHGVPRERLMADILAGKSMQLHYREPLFFSSAIVGGILPIACGAAYAGADVWCFVGDMAASLGSFADAVRIANAHRLPMHFIVEDNGLSTNSPTGNAWGPYAQWTGRVKRYWYTRGAYPHVGTGTYVPF
jgi:Dehydrogenase E1 component